MRAIWIISTSFIIACASGPDAQDFDDSVGTLQDSFGGDGKADLFGVDACSLISPLLKAGKMAMRPGFFVGVEGDAVLGSALGFGGYDIVADLYHQQMSVSYYHGMGLSTPEVGVSAAAYAGVAFGFEDGASDWDGFFAAASTDISLPFLKDYLSLEPSVFVSAEDKNGDHVITPNEVIPPPDGMFGFSIGVSAGFSPLPNPLPVDLSIMEGEVFSYKRGIRALYDRLKTKRILGVTPLHVSLVVDGEGGACPADWPNTSADKDCVIQFGNSNESYTKRAMHMAYAMCSEAAGCAIPLAWPMSATTIAVGAFRDSGANLDSLCSK